MSKMVCKNCGITLRAAMVKALLQDAGAKVYPDALHCDSEHEHEFITCAKEPAND